VTETVIAPARVRHQWMDILRGAAIILVISWHSAAILESQGYDVPDWLIRVNELFSSYRMPILMFLSGTLLAQSLAKPLPVYAIGKARRILWPLLLWGVLNYLIYAPETPIWFKVNWTTQYLWFLLYILIFYAFAPALRFLPTWMLVVIPFLMTHLPGISADERRFYFLAGFFFLGKLVSDHSATFQRLLASRRLWLLVLVVVPFSVVFAVAGPWRYWGVLAVFSVAGILLFITIARLDVVERHTGYLQFVGRNSIIFYCTHFPLILGLVALCRLLHVPVGIVIVLAFVLSMLVGSLFALGSRYPVVEALFVAPLGAGWAPRIPVLDRPAVTTRSSVLWIAVVQVLVSVLALALLLYVGLRFI
jgi:fucose 4-O-acetylase-like acetyltransferase